MHLDMEALLFSVGCLVLLLVCVSMIFTGFPVLGGSLGGLFGFMGFFTARTVRQNDDGQAGGISGRSALPPPQPPVSGPWGQGRGGRRGGGGTRVPARPKTRPPSDSAAAAIDREK